MRNILGWAIRNVLSTGYAGGEETWRVRPPRVGWGGPTATWGRPPRLRRRKSPLHKLKALFWIGFGLWLAFGGGIHVFTGFLRWVTSLLSSLPPGGIQ